MNEKWLRTLQLLVTCVLGIALYQFFTTPTVTDTTAVQQQRDTANVYITETRRLHAVNRALRDSVDLVVQQKQRATLAAARANARLDSALSSAQSIATDTASGEEILRNTLVSTIIVVRQYQDTVAVERALSKVVQAKMQVTIDSMTIETQNGLRAISEKQKELDLVVDQNRCEILGRPCPSRKTSFVGGMIATFAIVLTFAL